MEDMTFSIVIIGYNSSKTIEKCVSSCLNQTYKNIEVVFIDDGSSDNTEEIVFKFINKDSRIRYIKQSNLGSNRARIRGYLESGGEYVCFVDSDDYIAHNMIEELCYEFRKNPQFDIIVFDNSRFDDLGNVFEEKHKYNPGMYSEDEFLKLVLRREIPQYIVTRCYRRSFLKKMKFEDIPPITMGDDLAASVRMAIQNPNVLVVPNKWYFYRKNPNSVSSKPNHRYRDLTEMMKFICRDLDKIDGLEKFEKEIEFNYFILFSNYVVENKYQHTVIQQAIYDEWKRRNVNIKNNKYIQNKLEEISLFRRLHIKISNRFFIIGRMISRLYGLIKRR